MISYTREYRRGICSICGERIGSSFDHKECSAAKKEMDGASNEGRAPKKLSKKQCESIGKFYRGK